jgi:outer membrane usher protein FimD/PapC
MLYDARLSFEKTGSPFFVSVGQMNLYDTAGIGQLLGGALGYKPRPDLLIGGYAGLESSVYVDRVNRDYGKYGLFARYLGSGGKRLALSFNELSYSGETERRFIYAGTLFPVNRSLVVYANLEYELSAHVQNSDRLTRLFANVRWDPFELLDILAHFSSGKGLDFHRFLIERSKNPTLNDQELERFYYSQQYGVRLSLKPARGLRFYLERRESEQKDSGVRNHTWRLGASGTNLFRTGISAYGNYALNRGEISESDSFYLSLSKDFGRISWNVSFSNTFNGVRFDNRTGKPEIVHMDDYKTLSTFVFVPVTRSLAVSAEYEYFLQRDADQHLFFLRLILRN